MTIDSLAILTHANFRSPSALRQIYTLPVVTSKMPHVVDSTELPSLPPAPEKKRYLCLTICGFRRPGISEEDYRNHMVNVSAPLTKDLMVKYGVKRWTQIHNQSTTRAMMTQLFDHQMVQLADFDCFSQVFFEDLDGYKRMKQDPWYKKHLVGDHEKFADVKRSSMTIGWVEEYIRDGRVVDRFEVKTEVNEVELKKELDGAEIKLEAEDEMKLAVEASTKKRRRNEIDTREADDEPSRKRRI
ncbi:hypothetical protein LTR50_007717 [Elasticomyces elasticus]|nr:hypothetical protein LTR50_007717 [Elasticomyces elasticus]